MLPRAGLRLDVFRVRPHHRELCRRGVAAEDCQQRGPGGFGDGVEVGRLTKEARARVAGRAAQLGTTGATVVRDGTDASKIVRRSTFYRHTQGWLLVR